MRGARVKAVRKGGKTCEKIRRPKNPRENRKKSSNQFFLHHISHSLFFSFFLFSYFSLKVLQNRQFLDNSVWKLNNIIEWSKNTLQAFDLGKFASSNSRFFPLFHIIALLMDSIFHYLTHFTLSLSLLLLHHTDVLGLTSFFSFLRLFENHNFPPSPHSNVRNADVHSVVRALRNCYSISSISIDEILSTNFKFYDLSRSPTSLKCSF